MPERNELTALQGENARLIALLEDHGIEWRLPPEPALTESSPPVLEPELSRLSTAEKVRQRGYRAMGYRMVEGLGKLTQNPHRSSQSCVIAGSPASVRQRG